MPGRRSERIKAFDQSTFKDESEDEWSEESDTEINEKELIVSKEKEQNTMKQLRLITKTVQSTQAPALSSLQIKLKVPSRAPSPPQKKKKTEKTITLPKDMDPEPVCPICLKIIIGDFDEINEHVDECIGASPSVSSNINSGTITPAFMEETSKLHSSLSLVNVDEDDFGYGKSQYTESDIEKLIKSDNQNQKKSRATVNLEDQETKNSLLIHSILSTASPSPDFHALQLALHSLLDRIATAPKCAVCWETLKMPAVTSVNCWHVCCEVCWLRTLGTKRLCPHCSCITNPSDLRKVFF